MPNEADTCRRYVVFKLKDAGWDAEPHRLNEQVTFTNRRIILTGERSRRRPGKRADYILRYRPDMPIAVVEAKPTYATPGQGLQQAKDYAEILGLKFAYATNGHGIIEFDYLTGREQGTDTFPTPDQLWSRQAARALAAILPCISGGTAWASHPPPTSQSRLPATGRDSRACGNKEGGDRA